MSNCAPGTRAPISVSLSEEAVKERMGLLRLSLMLPRNPAVRPRPLGRIDHLCDLAFHVAVVGAAIACLDTLAFYLSF